MFGGDSDDETDTDTGWAAVDSPTEKTLTGVVMTVAGPVAVGGSGNVIARFEDSWEVVVDGGPAARRNKLTDVDVSDDGKSVWFCGSSGALGRYDIPTRQKYDYSAPKEKTSTWETVAVAGEAGSERLYAANGSGEVMDATVDGEGCATFGDVVKPGSGSTITALSFGNGNCYAIDTSGNAFLTDGEEWTDIGIRNAQVNFFDVAAHDGAVFVAAGGGLVYRYDRPCRNWTPVQAGEGLLRAIDVTDERDIVVGAGGNAFEQRPKEVWQRVETTVEVVLHDVALGETDVAVGEAGTVVERS